MSKIRNSVVFRVARNLVEYKKLQRSSAGHATQPAQSYSAYVINLERCPERLNYITSHLRSVGLSTTIVKAFDGAHLSMPELVDTGRYSDEASHRAFNRSLSLGEIGCSLSHYSIYELLVASGDPFALVVEDDAQFVADARERIDKLLSEAPTDWGVIQLRFDCRDFTPVSPGLVEFTFDSRLPVAATAYLVSREAARTMAAHALPIRYPADSMLGRTNQWKLRVFGAWPEVVGVNNIFPSAIQHQFGLSNLIKRYLLKLVR